MGKDSYVSKAKKYIHENVNKRIMLEDLSNEIGVSAGYLSGTFSKQCEISLIEYINKVKVEKAIKMIKERPYKIYEISNELGFDNSYYFSRVFKKQTGKTLSAYINSTKYE
jgi:two-component system response regulator YesN